MANFNLETIFQKSGAKVNHSAFDLSKRIAFSMPCGYLTPIYHHPCVPNEHHKLSLSGLLRTETMNTAAFVSGKIHVNFFFVPYSQLWHPFNSFVSQKNDKHSVRYMDNKFVPNVSLRSILEIMAAFAQQAAYNPSGGSYVYDRFGYNYFFHMARMLQAFGYGNYWWMFGVEKQTLDDWIDVLFNKQTHEGSDPTYDDKYVNIFPILAYQHIFYDYYRNKFYDTVDSAGNDYVETFNVDNITSSTVNNSHIGFTQNLVRLWFNMHSIQYKKDLFTSLMPSSQFGPVSDVEFDSLDLSNLDPNDDTIFPLVVSKDGVFNGNSFNFENVSAFDTSASAENTLNVIDSNAVDYIKSSSSIDVLTFRRAQLLQRWKQNALRAGNMVDDNFMSHYGVKPFYEEDNNVRFLGSFSCELNVNPVTATSTTGQSVNGKVGDLAAIGVGTFNGREIDFQCKDFGCIIGVAAFLPDVYYSANGISAENTLIEPFDFHNPSFNNVGFEPVPMWRSTLEAAGLGFAFDLPLGFGSPYNYLKTNVDEVYDEFSDFQLNLNGTGQVGSLSNWIFKRANAFGVNVDSHVRMLKNLYVNPNVTDPIFGITFDGTPATNPFLLSCTINHRAIRPLSVLGLPEF